jgi:signal transduction histidine kinase
MPAVWGHPAIPLSIEFKIRPEGTDTGEAMTGTGAAQGASFTGALLRAFHPLVSPRTWLSFIHLLAGVVTGALALAAIPPLVLLGIGTLWFFLAGLQLILAALWLARSFTQFERDRFAVTLGERIPSPPADLSSGVRAWRRVRRLLADPVTARQFGYVLIRLPLSALESGFVAAIWSLAVAMLGLPLFAWLLLRFQWQAGGNVPLNPAEMAGVALLGLVLLLAAPHLTQGVAAVDTAIARYLIGPGDSADMTVRIGELERSRARVVDAAEAERRRIERDLHDGAQQRLVSLAMNLGRAKARFADDPEAVREIIDQAHADAKKALADLRNLVRGVHPPVLSDRGLDAAISGLAALSPVPVTVSVRLPERPSSSVEAIAYFVVAEALTNVAKHAGATHAEVAVSRRGDVLRVLIRDDGVGGADPAGQGLAGLADRVSGVDGRLSVYSPAGGPTVIEAELSCGS